MKHGFYMVEMSYLQDKAMPGAIHIRSIAVENFAKTKLEFYGCILLPMKP